MATAQVLNSGTSSRKKDLEAGKRRLEEFRKKKAAERAKKASALSTQLDPVENHNSSETEHVVKHQRDSDRAVTSDGIGESVTEPSDFIIATNHDISATVPVHNNAHAPHSEETRSDDTPFATLNVDNNYGETNVHADGEVSSFHTPSVRIIDTRSSSTWNVESNPRVSIFDTRSSSDNLLEQSSLIAGTNTRRSRPSFLDSINMSSVYSATSENSTEPEKPDMYSSKIHPIESLASHNNIKRSSYFPADNGGSMYKYGVLKQNTERNHEFRTTNQNEDFAALEQHIEDLTQEKFSLQRAIEASRTLTESLAAENSALTDSYNQQGSVVHQLRSDMEKLQDEIKFQLVELESLKLEYTNAHLECSAADERAKLLASEVIGLDEKALRLRSSELKLERQLEHSQAEISSYKKKIGSLKKDREDLQLIVDALQEEKKLLQFKLRKASGSGKVTDVSMDKTDFATSTEDLGAFSAYPIAYNSEANEDSSRLEASTSFPLQPEEREFNLEDSSLYIPPDQIRMIQNINTLISELGLEKEELVQALSAKSSQGLMLKELNKELSRKLEAQTQRLELLTAQSMAIEYTPPRQTEPVTISHNTAYADEGDEVVERVIGWIMKLFPGGPSRRRSL